MSLFTKQMVDIAASVNAAGQARQVANNEMQVWGTEVERLLQAVSAGAGVVFASKAEADADLDYADDTMAWVFDSDPALAGVYQKVGASGAGTWERRGNLPYSFIKATNAGAGTPDAIVATTTPQLPSGDGAALVMLNIVANNTGAATVSFDGGTALTIKTNNMNDVQADYLVAGSRVIGVVEGANFVLMSEVGTAADKAAAEAAAADAIAAAAASNGTVPVVDRAALKALDTVTKKAANIYNEVGYLGDALFDGAVLTDAVTVDTNERFFVPPDSDPTGASGAWVRRWDGVFRPEDFKARGIGELFNDTTAIQGMWDAVVGEGQGQAIQFTPGKNYYIDPILAPVNNTYIDAGGAVFILASSGVGFDFNPDADPSDVNGTAKSYGYWRGGKFTSVQDNPITDFIGMQVRAIRQMRVEDVVFGTDPNSNAGSNSHLTEGILFNGLGGHKFINNRFYLVDTGFNSPHWQGVGDLTNQNVTTTLFLGNEFILGAGDQAMDVDGGWERWRIIGGFCNGSEGVAAFRFTNRKGNPRQLLMQGLGCEQAAQNSQFVYFEDVEPTKSFSDIAFRDCEFAGDPAGGGHSHIKMERVIRTVLTNVRTSAGQGAGNWAIERDANCVGLTIDAACRLTDAAFQPTSCISTAGEDREEIILPSRGMPPFPLSGYNGASFSTSNAVLDMSTLITGNRYPKHGISPRGYTLMVRAQDSASTSGLADRKVEFGRTSGELGAARNVVNLGGVPDDQARTESFYQAAHTDGSIWVNIFASGADTLDLWIYVLEIHM